MNQDVMRHSAAHIMAAAVGKLYPKVLFDIGPATEDGFYYDFDLPDRLSPDDFPKIEAEMASLIAADLPFERLEMTREQARSALEAAGQSYKIERLADIPAGEPIVFYRSGDFMDLCRGPHVSRSGEIKAFKLLSVAGSYYRGLETNPMLQRVYGAAFETQAELDAFLARLEEIRKRDHRRLGRELGLFSFHEEIGPGLVHWLPKGARVRRIIEDVWRREHARNGYELLYTPHIGKAGLWETSGHLDFYRESMYAPMEIDKGDYYIKPMNCPFHIMAYKTVKRSYRELPIRFAELGTVYRYEKAGVLHGLFRVRGFTQDDAHIFCMPGQIKSEILQAVRFSINMFKRFGFETPAAYLSTRPKKAIGEESAWTEATAALQEALEGEGIAFKVDEGGGAFYGPKVDLKVKDALGREWQTGTVQFDFNIPERFDVVYTGDDGREHRPYMVHRALLGSLERFFGVLIEHYAGAFPLWLAPEQVRVLPITDKQAGYARELCDMLLRSDFRADVDAGSDKIGARIRAAQMEKIPYMAVVGAREHAAGTVSVRSRSEGDRGAITKDEFVAALRREVEEQTRDPQEKDSAAN